VSRLELPDGGWCELWAPKQVKERRRRAYIAAITDLTSVLEDMPTNAEALENYEPKLSGFGGDKMALSDRVGDMLILCLVREWDARYGEISEESIQDLPAGVFDVIFLACRDLATELTPNYGEPVPKAKRGGSTTSPTPSPKEHQLATLSPDGTF